MSSFVLPTCWWLISDYTFSYCCFYHFVGLMCMIKIKIKIDMYEQFASCLAAVSELLVLLRQ